MIQVTPSQGAERLSRRVSRARWAILLLWLLTLVLAGLSALSLRPGNWLESRPPGTAVPGRGDNPPGTVSPR
jgi:hypothetical protein